MLKKEAPKCRKAEQTSQNGKQAHSSSAQERTVSSAYTTLESKVSTNLAVWGISTNYQQESGQKAKIDQKVAKIDHWSVLAVQEINLINP